MGTREIRWTEWSEDHVATHGVSLGDVEQVGSTRPRLVVSGRGAATYLFGTTAAGRYLMVVLVAALDGRDYVATARDMTASERRTFRRKAR